MIRGFYAGVERRGALWLRLTGRRQRTLRFTTLLVEALGRNGGSDFSGYTEG